LCRRRPAQATLEKLLASPHFPNARRLSEFLRFVTLKAMADETAQADEYPIAFEIYGRDPDSDPKADSIVRVEANRLRASQSASDCRWRVMLRYSRPYRCPTSPKYVSLHSPHIFVKETVTV
jgi:hypothetical protein